VYIEFGPTPDAIQYVSSIEVQGTGELAEPAVQRVHQSGLAVPCCLADFNSVGWNCTKVVSASP
jgi:hypothetical protein